jgi:hypothetical protein
MSARTWRSVAWVYHLLFLLSVVWPGQAMVNTPTPLILGLPRQIAWIAAWLIGSLVVLWRLDRAEGAIREEADGG